MFAAARVDHSRTDTGARHEMSTVTNTDSKPPRTAPDRLTVAIVATGADGGEEVKTMANETKQSDTIEYSSPAIRGKCYECGQVRGDFHVDSPCPNCDGSDWMSTDTRFDSLAGVSAMLQNSGVPMPQAGS